MTQDLRTLIETMAIKLDVMTQMLKGDMSLTDPLADRARAALAVEAVGPSDVGGDAHELWALAQLAPDEGIEDGVDRIAQFLACRGSAPRPIPVGERLPGAEDCDAEGRCWWQSRDGGTTRWILCGPDEGWTLWLPAHALPLPAQEGADD